MKKILLLAGIGFFSTLLTMEWHPKKFREEDCQKIEQRIVIDRLKKFQKLSQFADNKEFYFHLLAGDKKSYPLILPFIKYHMLALTFEVQPNLIKYMAEIEIPRCKNYLSTLSPLIKRNLLEACDEIGLNLGKLWQFYKKVEETDELVEYYAFKKSTDFWTGKFKKLTKDEANAQFKDLCEKPINKKIVTIGQKQEAATKELQEQYLATVLSTRNDILHEWLAQEKSILDIYKTMYLFIGSRCNKNAQEQSNTLSNELIQEEKQILLFEKKKKPLPPTISYDDKEYDTPSAIEPSNQLDEIYESFFLPYHGTIHLNPDHLPPSNVTDTDFETINNHRWHTKERDYAIVITTAEPLVNYPELDITDDPYLKELLPNDQKLTINAIIITIHKVPALKNDLIQVPTDYAPQVLEKFSAGHKNHKTFWDYFHHALPITRSKYYGQITHKTDLTEIRTPTEIHYTATTSGGTKVNLQELGFIEQFIDKNLITHRCFKNISQYHHKEEFKDLVHHTLSFLENHPLPSYDTSTLDALRHNRIVLEAQK